MASKGKDPLKRLYNELHSIVEGQEARMAQLQRPDSQEELQNDVAQLWAVLGKIDALQTPAAASQPVDKAERGKAFREWFLQHAPESHLGKRCDFDWHLPEGSGVVALQDLDEGEQFLAVPRRLILSADTAFASTCGAVLARDNICTQMPSLALAVFVALERHNSESFWKPYLDILPTSFLLPLWFDAQTLQHLEGSPILYDVLRLKKSTMRQYDHLHRLLKKSGFADMSYRDFLWGVSVVMTRQNRIPKRGKPDDYVLALIPGWDMCNYADGKITTFFDGLRDESQSAVMKPVKKGEQIYIYYGDRTNWKLFVFSGFVYEAHPNDAVEFLYGMTPEDPLLKLKMSMLAKRKFKPREVFSAPSSGDISSKLLDYARLCVMDKEDAAIALKHPEQAVLGPANEKRALQSLLDRYTEVLKAYPTSIEQDDALLQADDISPALRLVIRLRRTEKRLLARGLESLNKQMDALLQGTSAALAATPSPAAQPASVTAPVEDTKTA